MASAAAAQVPARDDLMKMLILTMLSREIKKGSRANAGDGDSEDEVAGKQDATTRAFARYGAYKQAARDHPDRVIRQYRENVKTELGIRPGDRWNYRDWWKSMPFGRYRSVGRLSYLLTRCSTPGRTRP